MTVHASHPEIIKRLKRAEGHLRGIVGMLAEGRGCLEVAQQLQAVERAVANAKKALVQDHIDHCLDEAVRDGSRSPGETIREFRELCKYL
ncbi:metal-sensing transcriptional repressor [Accumulibacter sp.]|uniref:metal-sensing transcriptional repressor n=1 Tax=Accumulibacter sp. TaxID=2053492 RepID=UPI0025E2A7CF|nr:metal-sensing transcriptional repressor [Accumulibacter sp.]MCM8596171.1 metal-sensing transcriptional repressor [Accumulibacter sp.]MCM8625354.1 metal-sensing transcriptional repressor [Accumulibacter sp.]MDS4050320.1 metal-sensing transcriptional repressor [Accumulibacter sp.]